MENTLSKQSTTVLNKSMVLLFIKLKSQKPANSLLINYNILQPRNLKIRYILGYLINMSALKLSKTPSIFTQLVLKVRRMKVMKKRLLKRKKTMITMEMSMAAAVIKIMKIKKTKMMDMVKRKLRKKMPSKKMLKKKSKEMNKKTKTIIMVKKLSNQMRENKLMKIPHTIFKTIIIMIMANMGNNKMKRISNMKEVNSQIGYFF